MDPTQWNDVASDHTLIMCDVLPMWFPFFDLVALQGVSHGLLL